MELALHTSATLSSCNSQFLTNAHKSRFPGSTRKCHFHAKGPSIIRTWKLLSATKPRFWINEQENGDPQEEEEEEEEDSYSDEDSALLSLSMKPDRNMALLDDYELEELDYASGPNHRSGESLSLSHGPCLVLMEEPLEFVLWFCFASCEFH